MSKRRIRADCTRIKNKKTYICVCLLREEPGGERREEKELLGIKSCISVQFV